MNAILISTADGGSGEVNARIDCIGTHVSVIPRCGYILQCEISTEFS